jgi:asparagine synthase (glutamine-hydrolysing)
MCGIGALFTKLPLESIGEIGLAIAKQQYHRGPDYQATYVAPHSRVALSHDRLSIIDLSPLGNQPMTNEDHTVWLVCNGEIYNHGDLRKQLQTRGHHFSSYSDCEVILHLYEEYGYDLVGHLHGMFAFVVYDATSDLLFCARDRLGKKPLVYAETAAGVAIASEIPAVRCMPMVDTSIDPVALGLYLLRNTRHIPDPWTFYHGIRRLNPGHAMVVEEGRIRRIWRYWHPIFTTRHTTVEEVREAFDRAVAVRMVADVEVGALLSGGVDSSGIVQAMVSQGTSRVRTYAMGRDENDEELLRARYMARLLGTEHQEFYFDPHRQHEQFIELLRLYGEPIMLLPLLYTYELCQRIRDDGLRVVMAGHGADELFYGYGGHNDLALLTTLLPFVPRAMRPWLYGLARCFPARSRLREALLVAATPAGERKARLYREEAKRVWSTLLDIGDIEPLVEEAVCQWLGTWLNDAPPDDYIDEASIIGLMHENSHSVTIAGDLPAMAASIEVRCPFLDQDVVELAWRIPYRLKIKHLREQRQNKWILKRALDGRVPQDLLYAAKRGFGYFIQEENVLRGPWKAHVDDAFWDAGTLGGIINSEAVKLLKATFDRGVGVPPILIAKLYAALLFEKSGPAND